MQIHMLKSMQKKKVGEKERDGGGKERERGRACQKISRMLINDKFLPIRIHINNLG